jgi:hypothetical protein
MKFTKRAGLAGVSLSAVAVLATTAALATSAASAAPSHAAIGACHSPSMEVWTGEPGDGFAGGVAWEVEISNIGHHACTLFGYPGVSELNGNGHQVGLPASHSGPKFLVTIPVAGTAHFLLTVHDPAIACPASTPVHGVELRVFAPGQFNAERTPFSLALCPHRVNMEVDAVHAGTGIPGFSG